MYWGLVQGRGGEFLHGILKKYIFLELSESSSVEELQL